MSCCFVIPKPFHVTQLWRVVSIRHPLPSASTSAAPRGRPHLRQAGPSLPDALLAQVLSAHSQARCCPCPLAGSVLTSLELNVLFSSGTFRGNLISAILRLLTQVLNHTDAAGAKPEKETSCLTAEWKGIATPELHHMLNMLVTFAGSVRRSWKNGKQALGTLK